MIVEGKEMYNVCDVKHYTTCQTILNVFLESALKTRPQNAQLIKSLGNCFVT